MPRTITVSVSAAAYADYDDSLTAAACDYAAAHGLRSWQVDADWEDDDTRETIVLTVVGA